MNKQWDQRYMRLAKLVASWSKDPSTQCGAVIVRPNKTLASVGFNGFPRGMEDNPEKYNHRETKYTNIIHSERNAISTSKEPTLKDYTVYAWPMPPCEGCTASLVQKGIKRVVCPMPSEEKLSRWKESFYSAKDMWTQSGATISYQNIELNHNKKDKKETDIEKTLEEQMPFFNNHSSLKWHLRFLMVAQLCSTWSKDPLEPNGVVLARPDHTIASIGFNGYPQGVDDTPLINNDKNSRSEKLLSAELNGILFAEEELKGCVAYTWPEPPTLRSTVHLIQEGIRHIICPDFKDVSPDVIESMNEVGGHVIQLPITSILDGTYHLFTDQTKKTKKKGLFKKP